MGTPRLSKLESLKNYSELMHLDKKHQKKKNILRSDKRKFLKKFLPDQKDSDFSFRRR